MPENKTRPTTVSVAAFIEAIADETRRADARTLVKIMQRTTGEKPKMWGPAIIGFGSYHYTHDSGREGDMAIACFSPRKAVTVLYQMTGFSGSASLLAKLGKHSVSGSCLHIKKLADINLAVLEELIAKSVAAIRASHPE
ncbi:MAG: DUF1801 domain-containing protein [Terracidiphilus sp.]|jgi:hypothetical protein